MININGIKEVCEPDLTFEFDVSMHNANPMHPAKRACKLAKYSTNERTASTFIWLVRLTIAREFVPALVVGQNIEKFAPCYI